MKKIKKNHPESKEFLKLIKSNSDKLEKLNKEYESSKYNLEKLLKSITHKKSYDNQLQKTLEIKYNKFNEICLARQNLANESYFLLENEIKKITNILEKLRSEQESLDINNFPYINYTLDKNFDEIYNIENYINSKRRAKGKKPITDPQIMKKTNKFRKINGSTKLTKRGKTKGISKKANDNQKIKKPINPDVDKEWEDITYQELDGKIGPKEAMYCFCNYISYGNMIKCDNSNCERKWFHFHCVGLKDQPKGRWFCSEQCANEFQKKITKENKENSISRSKSREKKSNK